MTTDISPLLRVQRLVDSGNLSAPTIHRYVKNGWLEKINIAGSAYITRESFERLIERARRGEIPAKGWGHLAEGRRAAQRRRQS
jgi:hypothetical protein